MNSFTIAILLYAVAGTAIAIYARRYGLRGDKDYYIAGRNVGGLVSALTYAATTYSAFMMVGLVGLSYATGVGAYGFEMFYLLGTLMLLSYYGPKIWRMSRESGAISPAELIGKRFGTGTAMAVALISLVALIPYTSSQLIGVSLVVEKLSGIDFSVAIAISALLIALWAFIGGLRGVAWTDAVQGVIMLSAAVLAVAYVYSMNPDFAAETSKLGELMHVPNRIWTPQLFIKLTVPWFFFALTNPQVFQRLFIPKDERALKRMVVYFGLFGLVYTVMVTLIGLMLRVMAENGQFPMINDRDLVTPTLLSLLPSWLSLLIGISILSAAITTANSIILSLSSMVSRDIARSQLAGRAAIVVLTIAVAIFASTRPAYIVELAVMSSTLLLSTLPLVLAMIHTKFSRGLEAVIAGFVTALVLSYMKYPFTGVAVLAVGFAVLLATNLIKREEKA
ncbi:Na+/proline symporter [Geoglobus ahangari]|uniref:Na+/proline symporter n=1 Tax=Geoglobus ahangari TaxID=113653 RepID=A0A0F7DC20_9EURY|nr:sodium:solute symporter family protein [Geoglobus ahangari]AKG92076.1 Na+/proline symporter [Geoglobus ahangari]